jgi:hypothetical protein
MGFDTESARASAAAADDNVIHPQSSNYARERVKWEANYTRLGPPGRPYVKRDFPMVVYLGGRPEGGLGADTVIAYETVGSEREFEQWRQRGYRETPNEALAAFAAQELEFAKLNANLEHQKRHGLSEGAVAEVEAAQNAVTGHLPMVPETPIVRRQPREVK